MEPKTIGFILIGTALIAGYVYNSWSNKGNKSSDKKLNQSKTDKKPTLSGLGRKNSSNPNIKEKSILGNFGKQNSSNISEKSSILNNFQKQNSSSITKDNNELSKIKKRD